MDRLEQRTGSVIVVDGARAVRPMMVSTLKTLGFARVMAVSSLAEVLQILQREPCDWLITSLFLEQKVNALQVLALARETPSLQKMLVSLFVSESEQNIVSRAFSLGLFTLHARPFNQVRFSEEIGGVLEAAERLAWNSTLVSAEYVRNFLRERQRYSSLVEFQDAVRRHFPEDARQLLDLAEACFLDGDDERARALLWQAEQQNPALSAEIKQISTMGNGTGKDEVKDLGVKLALVIDPDGAARKIVVDAFKKCGTRKIIEADDGEEAWKRISSKEPPEVIVMEWRIPKVTGSVLVQRIRSAGLHLPAIIVLSSLVGRKDEPLLREMGVATVLEKPARPHDVVNCLTWTVGQTLRPSEQKTLEIRVRGLLRNNRIEDAAQVMQAYIARGGEADDASRRLLEAEFSYALGDFETAKALALESLSVGGNSVVALNLLGKILMALRDFPAALQVFERANEVSPNSLERLCSLAETQAELGREVDAVETLAKATKVDAENDAVVKAGVNIGLATGNKDLASEQLARVKPSENVLAYINNRAVAHAKAGDFQEGIRLYANALDALPESKKTLRSVVLYNLAMAHARDGDAAGAAKVLASIDEKLAPELSKKVDSLLKKAQTAVKKGDSIRLNTGEANAVKAAPAKAQEVLKRLRPQAMDKVIFCCHGLYVDTDPRNDLVDALLASLPRFTAAGS